MKLPKIKRAVWFQAVLLFLTSMWLPHLALAESVPVPNAPAYVAFGDSLTTGSTVATCRPDRSASPWGCSEAPAVVPYPNRVARSLHLTYSNRANDYTKPPMVNKLGLYRVGIWGYTAQEAVEAQYQGHNAEGNWIPQYNVIRQARQLVTGSLGINDLQFSNVSKWARLYLQPGGDHITPAVQAILKSQKYPFDLLFSTLRTARQNGATVVFGLYYNPYDTADPKCDDLKTIGQRIVDALDDELLNRAHLYGISVADFRRSFSGHGAGSQQPYVVGNQCSVASALINAVPAWLSGGKGKQAVAASFDPHPNNAGSEAMAKAILEEVNNAD